MGKRYKCEFCEEETSINPEKFYLIKWKAVKYTSPEGDEFIVCACLDHSKEIEGYASKIYQNNLFEKFKHYTEL